MNMQDIYNNLSADRKALLENCCATIINPRPASYIQSEELLSCTLYILCISGCCNIDINSKPFTLTGCQTITVLSGNTVKNLNFSSNFRGDVLLIDRDFNLTIINTNGLRIARDYARPLVLDIPKVQCKHMELFFDSLHSLMIANSFDKEENIRLMLRASFLSFYKSKEPVRHQKRKEDLVSMFLEAVEDDGCMHSDINYFANRLSMSANHLSRIVKEESGKTPGEWISGFRVEKTKKLLLKDGAPSLASVGESVGFSSESSFSRFFKKQTGLSPIEFRNGNH